MVEFRFFLRLLDRYPLNCQVKGVKGGTWFNPYLIVITCPRTPAEEFVYRDKWNEGESTAYEDIDQVIRRCDVIMKWDEYLRTWLHVPCGSKPFSSGAARY